MVMMLFYEVFSQFILGADSAHSPLLVNMVSRKGNDNDKNLG